MHFHLLEESGGVDFIRSVRSRRNFEMSPHGQFFWIFSLMRSCLVGLHVSCSGFVDAGSMRFLGLLPLANSNGFLPLRVTCVSHRCSFAHQLGRRDL